LWVLNTCLFGGMESRWRFHDHVWAKLLLKRFRRFIGNPLANLLESVRRYRKPCEKFVTGFKPQIKSSHGFGNFRKQQIFL
jgi:hypothetical protein